MAAGVRQVSPRASPRADHLQGRASVKSPDPVWAIDEFKLHREGGEDLDLMTPEFALSDAQASLLRHLPVVNDSGALSNSSGGRQLPTSFTHCRVMQDSEG